MVDWWITMCGGRTPNDVEKVKAEYAHKEAEANRKIEEQRLQKEECVRETQETNTRLETEMDLTEQSKTAVDAAEKRAKADFSKWKKDAIIKHADQEQDSADILGQIIKANKKHEETIQSMYQNHIDTLEKERDDHHKIELDEAEKALQQRTGRLQEIERLLRKTEEAHSNVTSSMPLAREVDPRTTEKWVSENREHGLAVRHLMDMMIQAQSSRSHGIDLMFTEMTQHHIAVRDLTREQVQEQTILVERLKQRLAHVENQIVQTKAHRDKHSQARNDPSWFSSSVQKAGNWSAEQTVAGKSETSPQDTPRSDTIDEDQAIAKWKVSQNE